MRTSTFVSQNDENPVFENLSMSDVPCDVKLAFIFSDSS